MAIDQMNSGISAMSLLASLLHTLESKSVITHAEAQQIVQKAADDCEQFPAAAANILEAFKGAL